MQAEFWHQRWEKNEIGFHEPAGNPLLVKYFDQLSLPAGSRVFLPLCGKTRDIDWLLSGDYRIAASELSEIAVEQLFARLGMQPTIAEVGALKRYSDKNIDVFVGDIFELSKDLLGAVDAIYDRAALVALPEKMRREYAAHLMQITQRAVQLLICFEYDQTVMEGPPFSITNTEVQRHYSDRYELRLVASVDVAGGLKGKCEAQEHVWLLR